MSVRRSTVNGGDTKPASDKVQLSGSGQLSGEIGRKYKLLVQILTSDPRYAKALAEVIPSSQHERLSEALTNISYEIGASLSIIKSLIGLEFNRKKAQPTTILRSNSIVSKMISRYCKLVGTEYLGKCIGQLTKEVNEMKETLEVDKEKMKGDNIDQRVEENLKKTAEICQNFVDRIISRVMIDEMPRQLRAICYFLVWNGEQYKLELEKIILPLIAGFIMLRYINTAITLPNNYGLLKAAPSGVGRANLTLVAKVLQKMANGETFQTEAPHLMPLNDFIQKNQEKWLSYLRELPKDPEEVEGRLPFGDLQKTISYEDIHFKTFSMEDLVFIHQQIYEYGYDLIVSLQTEVIMTIEKRPVSIVSHNTDFLALVQDLGAPPEKESKLAGITNEPAKIEKKASGSIFGPKKTDNNSKTQTPRPGDKPEPKAEGAAKKKENLKNKSFNEIQDTLLEKSMDTLMKNIEQFDLSELDQARFLYIGKPTKTNIPVFYLILSRVKPEFLLKNDKLMVYIYKTLQQYFANKYVLVIDLSWAEVDDEFQASLYRATVSFTRLIKQEYLSNCQSIYILHPNFKTQQAIDDILNIMPSDVKSKMVKTAYDWMDLSEVIEPNKIWIPFVSKKFTPLTYHLIKINNVDKRQERYMKITNESILNIDSKACTIQNEIMLKKIEEIRSKAGTNEIIIKYTAEEPEERRARGAGYFNKESTKKGIQTRVYTCYTEQQREIVVEAIFEAGIRAASLQFPQTFVVEKENNKKTKKYKRMLKLTTDSILVFKEKIIKTEIPFSTIQSFYLNPSDRNQILINFLLRGKKKQYILSSDNTSLLRDALLDAIKRFKFGVQIEKDLFYKKDYDAALDRFFLASKSKESLKEKDEESKWTNIMRIDQPCNDIVKLFKKFKPGSDGKAEINAARMGDILGKLKLQLKEEEVKQVIDALDTEEKGFIVLDDLVRSWVYMRRQRQMVQKRKQAIERKNEQQQQPPAAAASPAVAQKK